MKCTDCGKDMGYHPHHESATYAWRNMNVLESLPNCSTCWFEALQKERRKVPAHTWVEVYSD